MPVEVWLNAITITAAIMLVILVVSKVIFAIIKRLGAI